MESHQSAKTQKTHVLPNSKHSPIVEKSGNLSKEFGVHKGDEAARNAGESIGILEVYIHQARDIQNICIYHKQDVFAKLSLTSDPEEIITSNIVAAGGKNPIFNEKLRLHVRTLECSLKCEIWMLSRIKNYMGDQYLGFALVPLSNVLTGNVKLGQEFSLSSTDLTHAPAGFVQLSITHNGVSPDLLELPDPRGSLDAKPDQRDDVYDKIEFPDPKIINDTRMLVSEYFGEPNADLQAENSVSMGTVEKDSYHFSSDSSDHEQEADSSVVAIDKSANDDTVGSAVSGTLGAHSSTNTSEEKSDKAEKTKSSDAVQNEAKAPVDVNSEVEQNAMQQDIVDKYMKSVQEFTDSLAKMKLPIELENGSGTSTDMNLSEKEPAAKGNGSRVFYGSRAFF